MELKVTIKHQTKVSCMFDFAESMIYMNAKCSRSAYYRIMNCLHPSSI